MKNLEIENILPVLYTFYNKKLYDSQDSYDYTEEIKYFIKHTGEFHDQYFTKWSISMERLAEKTNSRFWDTTHYNRQSFSCYFLLNEKYRILIMISRIYNIYYIEDETNSNHPLVVLLIEEMKILFPSYTKVEKKDLSEELEPYFDYITNIEGFENYTLHTALLGSKPTI